LPSQRCAPGACQLARLPTQRCLSRTASAASAGIRVRCCTGVRGRIGCVRVAIRGLSRSIGIGQGTRRRLDDDPLASPQESLKPGGAPWLWIGLAVGCFSLLAIAAMVWGRGGVHRQAWHWRPRGRAECKDQQMPGLIALLVLRRDRRHQGRRSLRPRQSLPHSSAPVSIKGARPGRYGWIIGGDPQYCEIPASTISFLPPTPRSPSPAGARRRCRPIDFLH